MGNTVSRKTVLDRDQSLIAGIQKHFGTQTFTIGKKSYAAADIITMLQGRVASGQAVVPAKASYQAAVQASRDELSATNPVIKAFVAIVQAMFNSTPDTLADFGLAPRKAPKTKVIVKAEAVAKNLATRKARGTVGKKQKARIKGTVSPSATTSSSTSVAAPQPQSAVAAPQPPAPKPTA